MNDMYIGGLFGCIALIWSGFTAYLLTRTCPHRRKVGWYSMIGMEFVIVSVFIGIVATGTWDTLKTPKNPMDSARAYVLFFFVACFLPMAIAAFKKSETLPSPMQAHAITQRMLHWTIALLLLLLILSGAYAANQGKGDPTHVSLVVAHKSVGVLISAIIVWMVVRYFRTPALDAPQLKRFQRISARIVTVLLAILLLAYPTTGLFMTMFAGKTSYFFFVTIPPIVEPSETAATVLYFMHRIAGPFVLYAAIALHLGAAFYHTYLTKDDVMRRMTG